MTENNPQQSNLPSNVSCRLTLKNIPENFSNEQLLDLLDKKFESKLKDIIITNLEHKYNSKNNKICFVTAENIEMRKKVFNFFASFEMIDPRGFKQKINIVDCLYQNPSKDNIIKDSIEGTIENISHFQKFKEYFEKGKLVDFKNEETNFQEGIFNGVVEETPQKHEKKKDLIKEKDKKSSRIIIMKKQNGDASPIGKDSKLESPEKIDTKSIQNNFNKESGIEIITQEDKFHKDSFGKFNKKGKKDGNYKGDKKYSAYNNEYYEEDYGSYKNKEGPYTSYDKNYKGYDKNYKGYEKNYDNNDKSYEKSYEKNYNYDKSYEKSYDKNYNKNYNNYDNYYDNGYGNGDYNNSSYYKKDYRKGGYK